MTKKQLDQILSGYCSNKKLRKRWAKNLVQRAIRFYVEGQLDRNVADEDLLDCTFEESNCSCLGDKHDKGCKYYGKVDYCNLKYSEKHERDYRY